MQVEPPKKFVDKEDKFLVSEFSSKFDQVWLPPPGVRPRRSHWRGQAGGDQMPLQVLQRLHGNAC